MSEYILCLKAECSGNQRSPIIRLAPESDEYDTIEDLIEAGETLIKHFRMARSKLVMDEVTGEAKDMLEILDITNIDFWVFDKPSDSLFGSFKFSNGLKGVAVIKEV